MSGYRQWHLPKKYWKGNTGSKQSMEERFQMTLDKWRLAVDEKRDIIVMMDTNLDTSNTRHNENYNVRGSFNMLQEHLNVTNMMIMNTEFTHFSSQYPPTCIDHFFTNTPNKLDPIKTIKHPDSDHTILESKYNSSVQIKKP